MWEGSAALCINEDKVLMVLQGKRDEPKRWSIPSGGKNKNESFEACCLRELEEETGYIGKTQSKLFVKRGYSYGIDVTVHYFQVEIIGGQPTIQDPDELIHEIRWVSLEELPQMSLSFPEDLRILQEFLEKASKPYQIGK